MHREVLLHNLVKTIILLLRIRGLVKDRFFIRKLTGKIYDLSFATVGACTGEESDQRALFQKSIHTVDTTLETVQDLLHLNLLRTSPLSLRARRNLLQLKLLLLHELAQLREASLPLVPAKSAEIPAAISTQAQPLVAKKSIKLNASKIKILNFIKSYPNTRTKDIIQEFNALSDRTVKRNLTELLHTGAIQKRIDNKAVYYYPSE